MNDGLKGAMIEAILYGVMVEAKLYLIASIRSLMTDSDNHYRKGSMCR